MQYPQDNLKKTIAPDSVRLRRDRAAAELVEDFCPRLYRYALVRLGRSDLAEEAVSEVLVRLLEKGPPLEGSRPHVHGWCVRCVVNVCREFVRSPRARSLEGSCDVSSLKLADFRRGLEDSEIQMLVLAVTSLSDRQQEAVILRVLMSLPVNAAAQAMQCAEGTVKALTHQGLASLRRHLTSLGQDAGEIAG